MRALVPVLLWVAAAAAGEEWRCPRGDLHNKGVVKNRGPVAKPQVVWERVEKETISRGVALAKGKLVYGVGEYVVACRGQASGRKLWNAAVKQQVSAWPVIENERVYVGSPDRVHHIIDFKNGKDLGGVIADAAILADPAVTKDYYLAGATDGVFYVMAAKNGRPLWKPLTGSVRLGAAFDRGRAYVVNDHGTVYALDLKKKHELWKRELKTAPLSAPIVGKAVVWLTLTNAIQGLKTRRGEMGARHELRGIAGPPVLEKSTLHYGTQQGEVVAFDLAKGAELRRVKVADQAVTAPLILARNVLYGAAGKTLFAVGPQGRLLWTHVGEEAFLPPIVADKAIYVAAGNVFYCLR
ncbi:MAG: outer membrane protein assembly factor BamB family protein [Planctomycetota bacterium]